MKNQINTKIKIIVSIVLGLKYDGIEEIRKPVYFCCKINTYKLQPAILTPYPGTVLFEILKEEYRFITTNCENYDMMNVVFKPYKISSWDPWDLQREFYNAARKFYSLKGAFKAFKNYGFESVIRRMRLTIAVFLKNIFFKLYL